MGTQVKTAFETTLRLQPEHADAYIALAAFHAEVIDKVGPLIGQLTYGAKRSTSLDLFAQGMARIPQAAIALTEYAQGLLMLDGEARDARGTGACTSVQPRSSRWTRPNTWASPGSRQRFGSKRSAQSPQGNMSVSMDSLANSGSNWSMMACGSGHSVAVRHHPKLHTATVAQYRHPQPHRAALRHPKQGFLDRGAANFELLTRAGHIGHHGRGLLGKQIQHGILRRLDEQPRHRQQAKGQQRLHAALEPPHTAAHFVNPLDGVFHSNRQHQRRQAKLVAQLVGMLNRAAGSPAPWPEFPCPATTSPCSRRYSPRAPATQLSSTSLIEQFNALPTAFTSSSGIGGHQATRLRAPGSALQAGGRVVGHQRQRRQVTTPPGRPSWRHPPSC